MTVTYFETQADAEAGVNPIMAAYTAGTKSLWARVTNGAGCYDLDLVQLIVLPSPGVVLAATDNTCTGAGQGSIDAVMFDGPSGYTYNWSNGSVQGPLTTTNTTLSGLNSGQYTVTVTDGNGCTVSASATVADGIPFTIIPIQNYNVEAGSEIGPIVLQTSTWGANFSWSGGTQVGLNNGTANSMLPLIPTFSALEGAATITVTATLGNCVNTAQFTINANDSQAPTAICQDIVVTLDENGNATITPTQIDGGSTDSYAAGTTLTLTASNESFSLTNLGVNNVMLTVTDPSGNTATCMAEVTVQTTQIVAPEALMSVEQTQSCMAPYEVKFKDLSTGNVTNRTWTFPGGVPATSTAQNPTVVYAQPGLYLAQLVVWNSAGESEKVTEHQVVLTEPTAVFSFSVMPNNGQVTFNNTSENAQMAHWSFGDGTESTEMNPVHTYAQSGTYIVELMTMNNCGVEVLQQVVNVTVGSVNTDEATWLENFRLFPNPNPGVFTVEMSGKPANEVQFILYDMLGQIVKVEQADFKGGDLKQVFNYGELPAGVYSLGIQSGENTVFAKVVVQR
jgi:PKD repeat protein